MASKTDILLIKLQNASSHQKKSKIRDELFKLSDKAVPTLIHATKSPDPMVRWESVNLLGQIQDPRAQNAVINVVLNDDDVHAKWRAIWAMSRFDRDSTTNYFLKTLKSKNKKKRWNAANALSLFSHPATLPILLEGLKSNSEWIRWEALNSLKSVAKKGTEQKIAQFLNPTHSRHLRQEAVLVLGNIFTKKSYNYLKKCLIDSDSQIRWRASMVLSKFVDLNTLETLKKRLSVEKDQKVKEQLKNDIAIIKRSLKNDKKI